jgi:hypothetical protein
VVSVTNVFAGLVLRRCQLLLNGSFDMIAATKAGMMLDIVYTISLCVPRRTYVCI